MTTALCIRVSGIVSKSLILIKRIYVLWICIVNIDDPFTVLVLERQVLDNNTDWTCVVCRCLEWLLTVLASCAMCYLVRGTVRWRVLPLWMAMKLVLVKSTTLLGSQNFSGSVDIHRTLSTLVHLIASLMHFELNAVSVHRVWSVVVSWRSATTSLSWRWNWMNWRTA